MAGQWILRGPFGEGDEGHRAAFAVRLNRHLCLVAGQGGRHDELFEKAAETDEDLTIKWIGVGQVSVRVAVKDNLVLVQQLDNPGLSVVRVRREDRIRKRLFARVGIGPRRVPGRDAPGPAFGLQGRRRCRWPRR